MNSLEALFSDARKVRSLRGQDLAKRKMKCSVEGIVIQKLTNRFDTMRSGIVSVNHKMSPWLILMRSKNFG
jgi:hypothetical protein